MGAILPFLRITSFLIIICHGKSLRAAIK
jgi:hypothetical protein